MKEKLAGLKENLNYVLKDIDSVGLSQKYDQELDEMHNPNIKRKCKFLLYQANLIVERIDRVKGAYDSYVYYG